MLALLFGLIQATTISFHANKAPSVDGPLIPNTEIAIDYDLARATCPSSFSHGLDTKLVILYYSINGKTAETVIAKFWENFHSEVSIRVPEGDLVMWFKCVSQTKTTYDSDNGKNFHFKVANVPSLVFSSDFTQQVKGELVAGGYVAIDYDIARAKCKSTIGKYGYDSKTVSAFVSLNGKEAVEQVVHLNKQTHKPHFKLAEKGQLAVWFKCSSSVDTVFDSNFSKNYIFTVQ